MAQAAKGGARRRVGRKPKRHLPGTWHCLSTSVADTDRLGRRIGRSLQGGEVIALYGELGSGKTALVRGMAAGLGASPQAVSSPTFVLIHEYHGRVRLAHADLYRLDSTADLPHLGLSDYDDGRTVTAIEWADKAGDELPADRLEIHLQHRSPGTREIAVTPRGARARRLLERMKTQQLSDRTAGRRRLTR
jgi:tRNA threonylcarbamoyladenosine biosynthesis protein TsaE